MKWFQHFSDSHTSSKGRQILRKYGTKGTGLFWICCELVAKDGEDYRVKGKKDWKITLHDITNIEVELLEEMLSFFAEINSISKSALNKGDLYIPQMSEYSDDYTKRVRRVSEHSPNGVRQDKNKGDNNTGEDDPQNKNFEKSGMWKDMPVIMSDKGIIKIKDKDSGKWVEFGGSIKEIVWNKISS